MTRHNNSVFRTLADRLWPRLLLGFFVPLMLFLAAAIVALFAIQRLVAALEKEQHSEEVLTKTFAMQKSVLGMAAAKRAHHLLGREEFRADFERLRADFFKNLTTLQKLVADNADQLARLEQIEQLESAWY